LSIFFDLGDPSKKLREDVLITLNKPVDFADPVSGRTYRLFQADFAAVAAGRPRVRSSKRSVNATEINFIARYSA